MNSIKGTQKFQDIVLSVKQTLTLEAQAVQNLSDTADERTAKAIMALHHSMGRVVVTGMGKSAIVGQKIVATLNSTGTNAIFMHAADAVHGDLGMIAQKDVVLCISKSGETSEIKVLIPSLKNFGNTLIGMTSNETSTLARASDFLLYLPMSVEADPNNLAPTTSTTLQMAMGDAVAICLLNLKGFTHQQFAMFHPGGSLGKQLYLHMRDMVDTQHKPKNYVSDNIDKIIYEIGSKRMGATVVFDDNENLIGIITDGDLRRLFESKIETSYITAGQIVQKSPKTILADSLAVDGLQMVKNHKIQQIIVMDGNRYVGVVHIHDFFREGLL